MRGEKDLLIVAAGISLGLHVDERELAAVDTTRQIVHGHGVGVHVAGAGLERRNLVLEAATRGNRQTALFLRAIQLRRYFESVPVHVLRHVGAIDDINGGRDSFPHADQGARRGSVVRRGRDCVSGRNIDLRPLDTQSDIGRAIRAGRCYPDPVRAEGVLRPSRRRMRGG